jgi:hypothetical protein
MTMRPLTRVLAVAAISLALAVPTAAPAAAHDDHHPRHGKNLPTHIDLPDGFQPEGITVGRHGQAYLGSLRDGSILQVDLRTGDRETISPGSPGTMSVGLKIDKRGRLFVSGGGGGTGRVVDSRSGDVLAEYQFATPPATFINDVVLTRHAAYFTDSAQAQLYVVPLGRHGQLPPESDFRTLPLTGDWEQLAGFNANGIERTPDGRALLVVQSNTGLLFRVNPRTGVARQVDLGGALLPGGDGLLLRGRTLYVVQGGQNQVAVVHLSRSGRRGIVSPDPLESPDFDFPTTVAAFRGGLYLPNARFTTPPEPDTDYWITRVEPRHHSDDDD